MIACVLSAYRLVTSALLRAAQVSLRVHHQPLFSAQTVLKHRIPRGEWYAVVPTFNYKIDLRKKRAHLAETGGMVA